MQEKPPSNQQNNQSASQPGSSQAGLALLQGFVRPWQEVLANPEAAQNQVLQSLLKAYAATEYGAKYGASKIQTLADFQRAFPVVTYDDYKPLVQQVMAGNTRVLLNEEPVGWAITRGTTPGRGQVYSDDADGHKDARQCRPGNDNVCSEQPSF